MKYKNQKYQAREAHARDCAMKLADLAGWVFALRPELLPIALRDHFYEPSAQLVLIPSAGGNLPGLETGVRETRCTALIVQPGATSMGLATVYFTIVRCGDGRVHWHPALRLWAGVNDDLFLAPDRDCRGLVENCFSVTRRGIQPATTPWTCAVEEGFGFGNADTLMLTPRAPERR